MFKTYDSTLQAYTEHPPKNYDSTQQAWIDSPSAKTFDTTQNAWVERLYKYWLTLSRKVVASVDTLEISPSKVFFDMPSNGYKSREVMFELAEHDITDGDVIEFDVSASYRARVVIYMMYNTTSGGVGSYTFYDKKEKTDDVNGHFSITIEKPSSSFKQWSAFYVKLSFTYENLVVGATAEVANLKINGKKIGFAE